MCSARAMIYTTLMLYNYPVLTSFPQEQGFEGENAGVASAEMRGIKGFEIV